MPRPDVHEHSIIPGRPALGRQQMPALGHTRCITLTRQTWLRDRFPCHAGLLAELCSNPEAYHLQQTLTIVWDHLLFASEFRASSWPLHTFSSALLTHKGGSPGERLGQRFHPRDSHGLAGLNSTVWGVKEGGAGRAQAQQSARTPHPGYGKWSTSLQAQGQWQLRTQPVLPPLRGPYSDRIPTPMPFPEP